MKRILVTGATGFIGKHCIASRLSKSYEVHAITSRLTGEQKGDIYWHSCDLFDHTSTASLIKRLSCSHLLHLAWHVPPDQHWFSLDNIRWVEASLNLFRHFLEQGGKRIIGVGSCSEYDWSFHPKEGFSEKDPCKPATLYGTSKYALCCLLNSLYTSCGLSSAWARFFQVYGPYQKNRLVVDMISRLMKHEPVPCSLKEKLRDYLYVEDAVEALIRLVDSEVQGPINIASGLAVSIEEIFSTISKQLDSRGELQSGKVKSLTDEPICLVANISRLQQELGWQQKYSLFDGLNQTIRWWQTA